MGRAINTTPTLKWNEKRRKYECYNSYYNNKIKIGIDISNIE